VGRTYHIYCDESSIGKRHSHMVLGGIMLPADQAISLTAAVAKWREKANMLSELKWTRVSKQKLQEYRAFVRGTMHYIGQKELWFRCMVLEQQHLDWRTFHGGDECLGYNKFLYQLVFKGFIPFLYSGDKVVIYPDERHSQDSLDELGRCLNRAACRTWGWNVGPVSKVEPIASQKNTIMQMNDVLLGAVAHQNNRREDVPGRDQAKVDLAAYVAELAALPNLRTHSRATRANFNIWQFRLRTKKAP